MFESIQQWFLGGYQQFFNTMIEGNRYLMLLEGLGVTVKVALGAAVIGILMGCVIALMALSKLRIARSFASLYVTVIRGTPVVVQLLIMYYIIMLSYTGPKEVVAIVTFGLNSAAYVSEMVRGGILAIDKGQTEAGRSLGLSGASTMLLIVLPQTVKVILPSLFNEFIMLLKETSVVGFIGLMDLAKAGDYIRSRTYSAFVPLLSVAAVYLVIVIGLTQIFGRVERRLRQGDSR
ncbi:amino acid ABC transporter permease [Eubacteriales bacterium OttesenSCG-928-N13]|nr:amino acid ABC transporter permease [Eubacteriales bacterium OttesenSCG-928-N13]